jgi:sulfide dehydrogenase [flavocytochrome c] flavoprotein subunit
MTAFGRRKFLGVAGASALATQWPGFAFGAAPHVVVVGGGAAGTVAAKQIALMNSGIDVTLIEQNSLYYSSLGASQVLCGMMAEGPMTFNYDALGRHGIQVMHDVVTTIDTQKRLVATGSGTSLTYDRLVLAPGIALNGNSIAGYDESTEALMPHAWRDAKQSSILLRQIESMRPGGTVMITVPTDPISSSTAPYERASHVARYLKMHNPTAKVLIGDAKPDFPMAKLFRAAWDELYPGVIEWISGQDTGGNVSSVDTGAMKVVFPKLTFNADVANIIPPPTAGSLADKAGVRDASGWCPVDIGTFESARQPGIHVIGDATLTSGLPKSAQIANSQAKNCAQAIVSELKGIDAGPVRFIDVDHNVIGPDYAFSSIRTYRPDDTGNGVVQVSSVQSAPDAPLSQRSRDFAYAMSWYNNISQEMFS